MTACWRWVMSASVVDNAVSARKAWRHHHVDTVANFCTAPGTPPQRFASRPRSIDRPVVSASSRTSSRAGRGMESVSPGISSDVPSKRRSVRWVTTALGVLAIVVCCLDVAGAAAGAQPGGITTGQRGAGGASASATGSDVASAFGDCVPELYRAQRRVPEPSAPSVKVANYKVASILREGTRYG